MPRTLKSHIYPFIGYFLAFISPVSWFIVAIEIVMFAEMIFGNLSAGVKKEPLPYNWKKVLLSTGLYVWLIMIARIIEVAFFKDTPVVSKILAGYITWNHVKQLIKNIDAYTGSNLWGQIEDTINKIKI